MKYPVICPACDEEFEIEAEAIELAEDTGCFADCPHCKETEIEFDYDAEADALTATLGQYEEDDTEQCEICGELLDDCTCPEEEDDNADDEQ